MTIKTSELKKILSIVKHGIGKPKEAPQPDTIIFTENYIMAVGYNTCVRMNQKTGIQCAIPSDALMGFVNKVVGEDLTISYEDNLLLVTCGKAKAKIRTEALTDETCAKIREAFMVADDSWITLPFKNESLGREIDNVRHACSTDPMRLVLSTVHVFTKEDEVFVEATDGRRAVRRGIKVLPEDTIPEINWLLLPNSIALLNATSVEKFAINTGWLTFDGEGIRFSVRMIDGKFPNVDQVIPEIDKKKIVAFNKDFADVVTRANSLGIEHVTLEIENENVLIRGKNDNIDFEDTVTVDGKTTCTTTFNAKWLLNMLAFGSEIFVQDDKPACLSSGNGFYVLMPIRVL